jgi:hypothetical protein
MAIIAENKGGSNIAPINAGNYSARCYSMVHIGTIDETIQNKPIQWINKVYLTFELPTEKAVFDETRGAEPRVCGKEFTLSMNEKAKLRQFLQSWRGAAFTDEQAKSFDVTKLLNVPCLINLVHKTSAKGNIYVEIATVAPPVSGLTIPELTNKQFEFNFANKLESFSDVPKFLREKIVRSKEWNAIEPATRARLIAAADAKSATTTTTATTTPPATVQTATGATVPNTLPF